MPEIEAFSEQLRQSWRLRKKAANINGQAAVLEMASFAQLNGIEPTKELVAAIRQQADAEWCEAEPGRCARNTAGTLKKAASPPMPEATVKIVGIHVARSPAPARKKKCCGNR